MVVIVATAYLGSRIPNTGKYTQLKGSPEYFKAWLYS